MTELTRYDKSNMFNTSLPEISFNNTEVSEDGSELIGMRHGSMSLPPFPDVIDKVEKFKELTLRDDDVIICSFPKSGTHWVANMVNFILRGTDRRKTESIMNHFFIDLQERESYENAPAPRILTTHLLPDYLPLNQIKAGKAKLINVTRNPKDVVMSLFYHSSKVGTFKGSLSGMLELFLEEKVNYGGWFNHVQMYKKLAEANNGLFLQLVFEDMKKDPCNQVRRLADYLGVTVTDEEIERILDKSSVVNMRQSSIDEGGIKEMIGRIIYRKGDVGDWKNHFTVAMNEKFDAEYERRTRGSGIKSIFEL